MVVVLLLEMQFVNTLSLTNAFSGDMLAEMELDKVGVWGRSYLARMELMAQLTAGDNAPLKRITSKVLEMAEAGDKWAIDLVYNRSDGPLNVAINNVNLIDMGGKNAMPHTSVIITVVDEPAEDWSGQTIEVDGVVE